MDLTQQHVTLKRQNKVKNRRLQYNLLFVIFKGIYTDTYNM